MSPDYRGTSQPAEPSVDPGTPSSSETQPQQPLSAQPLPKVPSLPSPGTDLTSSPDAAPRSPDWVLQGANLSQLTLTPLPRQKPPRKPPRARRPATLTGTFRDETGEPYSPVWATCWYRVDVRLQLQAHGTVDSAGRVVAEGSVHSLERNLPNCVSRRAPITISDILVCQDSALTRMPTCKFFQMLQSYLCCTILV